MGILNKLTEKLLKNFLLLKKDDWIKWIAQPNDWQDDCDKFNGCFFIVKQMPKYPQHTNCQCSLEKIAQPIPNVTAKATVDVRKFTDYVFSDKYNDGKKELFETLGYTIMDKYKDNTLVETTDAIILLNDNYLNKGLKAGYIGVVVDNLISSKGIILVDFFNPFNGEDISVLTEIKKEDFRIVSGSTSDQKLVKKFKDLFR